MASYKRGRTSILDEKRYGHPKIATTYKMVDLMHQTVMENSRLIVTSRFRYNKIIREVGAAFVDDRPSILAYISLYPVEYLWRFIIVDETWIHYHTSEMKQQLTQ